MKIELGKEYQTRDGREVRIYAVDGAGDFPIHGAILTDVGWGMEAWHLDGRYLDGNGGADLIPKPKVIEGWQNVYQHANGERLMGSLHSTKESAERMRLHTTNDRSCVGCIHVTFPEGEGL